MPNNVNSKFCRWLNGNRQNILIVATFIDLTRCARRMAKSGWPESFLLIFMALPC